MNHQWKSRWIKRLQWVAIVCAVILLIPRLSLAHGGGTPRLTDIPAGPYRLFAWTQPEPLRVGEIHLTVGVTTAGEKLAQPVTDATVKIHFIPPDHTHEPIERIATLGGVGAVYYETDASLPTTGQWRFIVNVQGPAGAGEVEFSEELLPMRTVNWTLLGAGTGLFVVLIVLIGVWNRRHQ